MCDRSFVKIHIEMVDECLEHDVVTKRSKGALRSLFEVSSRLRTLPSSYFLAGVACHSPHAGDTGASRLVSVVYRAKWKGQDIALKHFLCELEIYWPHPALIREVICWHDLKHPCIQQLLGIDRTTFAPQLAIITKGEYYADINNVMHTLDDTKMAIPYERWVRESLCWDLVCVVYEPLTDHA